MNKIKQAILYGVSIAAILAVSGVASAQTLNSSSNAASGSNATSASGSAARAQSGASQNSQGQNITFNSTTPSTTTSNVNTNQRENVNYSGGTNNTTWSGGDQTIRNAPTVYAPPVSGGNPCSLGASAGASFLGWGAAAGASYVDADCANRQKIAMIHNAGYAGAAKELMCNDRDTYFAFRTAGQACAFRPAFEGNQPAPQQPIVQQQPTQLPVAPVAAPAPRVAGPMPSQQTLRKCRGANDQGPCYSG